MSKRILIVEDHADIRTLIHMTLEFENYDIQEAPNADQGLEMVRQWRPDVLLLDEPTNHLDTESMEWLENWLRDFRAGAGHRDQRERQAGYSP